MPTYDKNIKPHSGRFSTNGLGGMAPSPMLPSQLTIFADAASEPEASEQVSSSNSYWALKVRFYFRFSDQNALLLTDENALLLTDQNALHA